MDNLASQSFQEDESDDELEEWNRTRKLAVVQLVCHVAHYFHLRSNCIPRSITEKNSINENREKVRNEILHHLKNSDVDCHNLLRMQPETFLFLCDILRNRGRLKDSVRACVEEKVITFLTIIAHNFKLRTVSCFFRRSIETISRHFHSVLCAVISLEDEYLKQPDGSEVSLEIRSNNRWFPYFKDCIGALDGTHIRVKVSRTDAPRFRGRKDYLTQNVLAACSFDLKFTYILVGWEGSASDSRIIKNALTREDNLKIPAGKYYLVDAGFMLRRCFIGPYRGVRYHLKEYSSRGPENAKELFNLRHAALRNTIEKAFGVLKKRFPIIGSSNEKTYSFEVQCEIVVACAILHNFLMGMDPDDQLINEVDAELTNREEVNARIGDNEDAVLGAELRNNIAAAMWFDYVSNKR